jgi:hypothetical protein
MMAALMAATLQGAGIAAEYPGDEGIEKDPRVLFVEDFETGDVREIAERWSSLRFPEHMSLSEDVAEASPGSRSLRIVAGPEGRPQGPGCRGGHLFTHVRPGDVLHARFYVKFHERHGYVHHFVSLIADRSPTPWPKGWAGRRPPGDSHFLSNIEPWSRWGKDAPPGVWNFYSYWQEMKPDGRGDYWGNSFMPSESPPVARGRWICVEARVKANSAPDAADGEQAFWIDGKLAGEFRGIRWRSTDRLKLNAFWLQYDVDERTPRHNNDPDPGARVYEVWFDDVVLATEYIGPVRGRPRNGRKTAVPSRSALHTGAIVPPSPGRVVFAERFDDGPGRFRGGRVSEGGLEFPPGGIEAWGAYSVRVGETTSLRFRLRPTAPVGQATALLWSERLKNNARFFITGLRKDEWRTVEIRVGDLRAGAPGNDATLEGEVLNNFRLVFDGPPEARLVLDDFEVRE